MDAAKLEQELNELYDALDNETNEEQRAEIEKQIIDVRHLLNSHYNN